MTIEYDVHTGSRRGAAICLWCHARARSVAFDPHLRRELSTWVDNDGMVVIRGRLTPDGGAVVQRALEALADRLSREAAGAPSGAVMTEELTPGQRPADALGLLAEAALAADLDRGTAGDRYQVVLHVEASRSTSDGLLAPAREQVGLEPRHVEGTFAVADHIEPRLFEGTLEVADGAIHISAEMSQRLSCDASLVVMRHDGDGNVLDVGRKTRTIPAAIRRALLARDTRCQFPGCSSRRCDAHHVVHSTPARTARAPGTPAGLMAAEPASITWCCCADAIIARYTKADSRSLRIPTAR